MPEWQPIKTAPKDGTLILLRGYIWVEVGFFAENFVCETCNHGLRGWVDQHTEAVGKVACDPYDFGLNKPTHWMPIPEHPHA